MYMTIAGGSVSSSSPKSDKPPVQASVLRVEPSFSIFDNRKVLDIFTTSDGA